MASRLVLTRRKEALPVEANSSQQRERHAENGQVAGADVAEDGVYCVCRKPWGGDAMVCCDGCESWFHPACIGMPLSVYHELVVAGDHTWFCHACTETEVERQQQQLRQEESDMPQSNGVGWESVASPSKYSNSVLEVGSVVCTCERKYHGELVLRCGCCQLAYHPDCVGLSQWEDWSDWRCNRCPRYATRRQITHNEATRSSSTCEQRGELALPNTNNCCSLPVCANARGVAAAAQTPAWAQQCSVGQLVTMAFEEPSGVGRMNVRHWPGYISSIEPSTGLLTINFDDGTVETNVRPDDADLNLHPDPQQHEASQRLGDRDVARKDADTPSNVTGSKTSDAGTDPNAMARGRLRLISPRSEYQEHVSESPAHKRPRLVLRHNRTAAKLTGARATALSSSRLRLVVGSGRPENFTSNCAMRKPAGQAAVATAVSRHTVRLTSSGLATAERLSTSTQVPNPAQQSTAQCRRRFRWKIGRRQLRRPLIWTVPGRSRRTEVSARPCPAASPGVHLSAGRATTQAIQQDGGRAKRKSHGEVEVVGAAVSRKEDASHHCPVCLCEAEDPIMTPCSHWFCRECLARAAKECGRRCPMCRRSLLGFARALLPEAGARVNMVP